MLSAGTNLARWNVGSLALGCGFPDLVDHASLNELRRENNLTGVRCEVQHLIHDDFRVRRGCAGQVGHFGELGGVKLSEGLVGFQYRRVEMGLERFLVWRCDCSTASLELGSAVPLIIAVAHAVPNVEASRPSQMKH